MLKLQLRSKDFTICKECTSQSGNVLQGFINFTVLLMGMHPKENKNRIVL